jgi:class 3 adenylate cyclase
LFAGGNAYNEEFRNEMRLTNTSSKILLDTVQKGRYEDNETVQKFSMAFKDFEVFRQRVLALQVTAHESNNYYSNLASILAAFILELSHSDLQLHMAIKLLSQLEVNAAIARGLGFDIFSRGYFLDPNEYRMYVEYITNEDTIMKIMRPLAGPTIMKQFDEFITIPYYNQYHNMSRYALDNPYWNLTQVDPLYWYDIMTNRTTNMFEMQHYLTRLLSQRTKSDMNSASSAISIVIIFSALIFLCSLVSAFVFSQAITGPWKRLIKNQDIMIKRFIPKGFLRIIKCYRISEITLGRSVSRDLSVLFCDIRNFTAMSESMTPAQIFNYLNNYLAIIGPIIRKNGGHIDKFMGDGILACFPAITTGIKASIEIQEAINTMNRQESKEFGDLRVGIGVHCGPVIAGTIGEHERMEGTIISDNVNLASRLETLTKAFRAKILTTQDAMKRVRNLKDIHYRPLGYVRVKGKKNHVKVYEVIDPEMEPWKSETSKQFKEAVDLMLGHNYEQSMNILREIVSKHPQDIGAAKVYNSCCSYLKQTIEQMKQLSLDMALKQPTMKDVFEVFVHNERSEENLTCWTLIEQYKNCHSEQDRIIVTKRIYKDYLGKNAKHLVNTNQTNTSLIREAIKQYDENLVYPEPDILNDLQTELELLMNDTFIRFKKSQEFIRAFNSSLPYPLVHIMDDEML